MKRVLVCGGRDFTDYPKMDEVLSCHIMPDDILIHGDSRGADRMSEDWRRRQYPVMNDKILRFPADWDTYGRAAGPIRNQQMLDEGKPDLVVAFPGGTGTADMVAKAKKAGIPVKEIPYP